MSLLVHFDDAVLPEDADNPGTRNLVLHEDGRVIRGIWEIEPGVVTDTEADEIFVVHSGRATVTLLDSGQVWELVPGSVGVFSAGERTEWAVQERLRKAYQITV